MSKNRSPLRAGRAKPRGDALTATAPPQSEFKSTPGLKRIINAVRYSIDGLAEAVRAEAAFQQELLLAVVLTPVALLLPVTPLEKVLLIGCLLMLLIVELLNSCIEAVVDRISLDRHHLSKRAKDMGSAAVMLTVILMMMCWGTIAGPVVYRWLAA